MPHTVTFGRTARKQLGDLARDAVLTQRITDAISDLADNPRPVGSQKLRGTDNEYRIRVGSYRVLYSQAMIHLQWTILRIRDRKDAYRK